MSSRLGRKDRKRWWFDALRTAVIRCRASQHCLVVVPGTAAAEASERAAELFGVPYIRLIAASEQSATAEQLAAWAETTLQHASAAAPSDLQSIIYMSPPLIDDAPSYTATTAGIHSPHNDNCLLTMGERVYLLSCRTNGNIETLLHQHLSELSRPRQVIMGLRSDHGAESVSQNLFNQGIVPWILRGQADCPAGDHESVGKFSAAPDELSKLHSPSPVQEAAVHEVEAPQQNHAVEQPAVKSAPPDDTPLTRPENWLCHWTRAQPGPWPDQSAVDYLDSLILGCETTEHSVFAALLRIVRTKTIYASSLSHGTVSFTQVPLTDFRKRRVYRRHLRRYDFEPWGIAVRRVRLQQLGARPVEYTSIPESAPTPDRHWLQQPATDSSGKINWSIECEWRLPGDLDLRQLSENDVVLFTGQPQDAEILKRL